MVATKNINNLNDAQGMGWLNGLISRIGAGSIGIGAGVTFTQPNANQRVLSSTGYSLTGSDATSMLSFAGTWNTTGTPTLLDFNVTDTASHAASLLWNLRVDGTSVFNVRKSGGVKVKAAYSASDVAIGPASNLGFVWSGNNLFYISSGGAKLAVENYTLLVGSSGSFGFAPSTVDVASADTFICRDAADATALRNGTNAQTFNIYNTYTSGSVYERGFMRWDSNIFEIGVEHSGATARNVRLRAAGGILYLNDGNGDVTITSGVVYFSNRRIIIQNTTAIPAGGIATMGYMMSSTENWGLFGGSGAPTLSAAQGSIYMRSDGSGTGDRMYINTDGGTTWTAVTTAA